MMDPYEETFLTWNSIAELYEKSFMELNLYNDTYHLFCQSIKQIHPKILEIGCGPGNITKYLLNNRPDFKLTGIDVSENMIALAQKNNPTATFKVMDCRDINTFTRSFNGIVIGFCIPYLSKNDGIQLIQNCSKLLATKGILYLSFVTDTEYHLKYITKEEANTGIHFHYYSLEDLKPTFENSKLHIINTTYKEYTTKEGETETHCILILEKQ